MSARGQTTEKVYEAIRQHMIERGTCPTFRALATMLGIKSLNTIEYHVTQLEKDARVWRDEKKAIRVYGLNASEREELPRPGRPAQYVHRAKTATKRPAQNPLYVKYYRMSSKEKIAARIEELVARDLKNDHWGGDVLLERGGLLRNKRLRGSRL